MRNKRFREWKLKAAKLEEIGLGLSTWSVVLQSPDSTITKFFSLLKSLTFCPAATVCVLILESVCEYWDGSSSKAVADDCLWE